MELDEAVIKKFIWKDKCPQITKKSKRKVSEGRSAFSRCQNVRPESRCGCISEILTEEPTDQCGSDRRKERTQKKIPLHVKIHWVTG